MRGDFKDRAQRFEDIDKQVLKETPMTLQEKYETLYELSNELYQAVLDFQTTGQPDYGRLTQAQDNLKNFAEINTP